MKALLLLPLMVFGDVGEFNAGTYIGPIKDLNCKADGGLLCVRDAGTSMGHISCNPASSVETGCVTPSAQTWAGTKTISTGGVRIVGVAHASLTACASGTKGLQQFCTGHNSPVYCDGTTNIEIFSSSAPQQPLHAMFVHGIPAGVVGYYTANSTTTETITALVGFWGAGTGSGSLPITIISGAGTCTCSVDCDVPLNRTTCSGNCAVPASSEIIALRGTSTCTLDPYVGGLLEVMGTRP